MRKLRILITCLIFLFLVVWAGTAYAGDYENTETASNYMTVSVKVGTSDVDATTAQIDYVSVKVSAMGLRVSAGAQPFLQVWSDGSQVRTFPTPAELIWGPGLFASTQSEYVYQASPSDKIMVHKGQSKVVVQFNLAMLWVGDQNNSDNAVSTVEVPLPTPPQPPPTPRPSPTPNISVDNAAFVSDITFPDGSVVSPGQSLTKTWRMQNTGTSTWGGGYQLVFREGNRLGAPEAINVPSTAPNQQVDLSVSLQIPSDATPGTYRASWRMRNSQGTYFGDTIWFSLVIAGTQPPSGNGVNVNLVIVNSPSAVSPGQKFQPQVTVQVTSGQLLQSRGDMLRNTDGNLYGAWPHVAVAGTVNSGQNYTFTFYSDNPITAPSSEGTYQSKWRVWANGGWVGPEITIQFTVYRSGSNRPPNRPSSTSPNDWAVLVGQQPTLCAQNNGDPDGDAISGYHFEIFQSAQNYDSGWVSSNCVTPSGLGNSGYQWHAQVRDAGGAVSDWSDVRHFNLESSTVTITDFHFIPASPSNTNPVIIWVETSGCGGVGVGGDTFANTANDGTSNGTWKGISSIAGYKTNLQDAPRWDILDYAEGDHLVRVDMKSCDGSHTIQDQHYFLTRGVPSRPFLQSPSNQFWSNSRTIQFTWQSAMRANNYNLIVGTTADPEQAQVLNVTVSGTSYTATFNQDYSQLYWRVYAINEFGRTQQDGWWVGIDRTAPTSAVNTTRTPALSYENQFAVSWDGNDNASGVQSYNVQFRMDNDPQWNDWLVNTPYQSAIFTGQPGHAYYFRTQAADVAGNVESPHGQPDTSVKVDPTQRPPQTWWNTSYTYKRNLVITHRMGTVSLPTGYPVQLHFDANTTPTAADIYNASLSPTKGNDVRVVYNDQTEIARYVINFTSSAIDIWFATQADIPASGSSSAYAMYYSNASAGTPPSALGSVFAPHPDEQTVALYYFEESGGNTPDYSGRNNTISWVNNPARGTDNGRHGGGVRLNGTQWGQATANTYVGNQLTVETWVWWDSLTNPAWSNPYWTGSVAKYGQADGTSWRLTLYNGNPSLRADLDVVEPNGNRGGHTLTWDPRPDTNRWYHTAMTYDGSTMRLWIDGNQVASTNITGRVYDSGQPIFLGKNSNRSDIDPPMIGRLDGVRVSNVARSSFPYGQITTSPVSAAGNQLGQVTIGQANLVMQSLSVIPNPSGGLLAQAALQNQGAFPTYNEFYITLYNRKPTGPGDLSGSVGFWVNSPIAAGQSISATTVLTNITPLLSRSRKSSGITESSGTLYAQADSTGVVNEPNRANSISQGADFCIASPDSYEPDNTPANATPITLGSSQTRNIYVAGDQDWVKFTAQAGTNYTIQTSNLGPNADTVLYLYGTDASTLLASNDDYGGTLASRIDWQAPASGMYYVMVKHWNPNVSGCGTNYDLSVSRQQVSIPLYLPIIVR